MTVKEFEQRYRNAIGLVFRLGAKYETCEHQFLDNLTDRWTIQELMDILPHDNMDKFNEIIDRDIEKNGMFSFCEMLGIVRELVKEL